MFAVVNLTASQLSDSSLLADLFAEYKYLKHLNVEGLPSNLLHDSVFTSISKLFFLETLNLSGCKSVLDVTGFFKSLQLGASNLRFLNLSNIISSKEDVHNSVEMMKELVPISQMKRLEHLDLGWNVFLTDDILTAICSNCEHLRYLNVSRCILISSQGFCTALVNLKCIEALNLSWCKNVDDSVLKAIFMTAAGPFEEAQQQWFCNLNLMNLFGCEVSWSYIKSLRQQLCDKSGKSCSIFV